MIRKMVYRLAANQGVRGVEVDSDGTLYAVQMTPECEPYVWPKEHVTAAVARELAIEGRGYVPPIDILLACADRFGHVTVGPLTIAQLRPAIL